MQYAPKRRSRGEWIAGIAADMDVRNMSDAIAFLLFWPAIAMVCWIALAPAHFASVVMGVLARVFA